MGTGMAVWHICGQFYYVCQTRWLMVMMFPNILDKWFGCEPGWRRLKRIWWATWPMCCRTAARRAWPAPGPCSGMAPACQTAARRISRQSWVNLSHMDQTWGTIKNWDGLRRNTKKHSTCCNRWIWTIGGGPVFLKQDVSWSSTQTKKSVIHMQFGKSWSWTINVLCVNQSPLWKLQDTKKKALVLANGAANCLNN